MIVDANVTDIRALSHIVRFLDLVIGNIRYYI